MFDKMDELKYIFEVKHTHRTNKNRPEPWFEIEASEILEYPNIDKIILHDIREFECETCKKLIPIFDKISKELGYFEKHEYYSYPVQKILDEAIRGKYFYYDDCWVSCSSIGDTNIWNQFLYYKRCIRCRTPTDTKKSRPYCIRCYKFLKSDERKSDENIEYFLKSKESERKTILREKLSFLNKVPGGWKLGDPCHFCDKTSIHDFSETKYHSIHHIWWFGDKKKICVNCLDEACRIKGIY